MTFKQFNKLHKTTDEERELLAIYLSAMRMYSLFRLIGDRQ